MTWRGPRPTGTTKTNGYTGRHTRLRKALLPQAYGQPCARCGQPMQPGQQLHLDHNDTRTAYLGFAHADCNRKAGARKGRRMQGRRKVRDLRIMDTSRQW